jgi:hypothetical protein
MVDLRGYRLPVREAAEGRHRVSANSELIYLFLPIPLIEALIFRE